MNDSLLEWIPWKRWDFGSSHGINFNLFMAYFVPKEVGGGDTVVSFFRHMTPQWLPRDISAQTEKSKGWVFYYNRNRFCWVIEKYSKLYVSDRTTKRLSYLAMFGLVFSATLFFALTQRNRHSNGAGHNLIRQSLFDLEATGICENMNYKLETRMVWKIF